RARLGSDSLVSALHQRATRMALVAARFHRSPVFSHSVCFILLLAACVLEGCFLGASVHSLPQQCHSCSQRCWSRDSACLTMRCSQPPAVATPSFSTTLTLKAAAQLT